MRFSRDFYHFKKKFVSYLLFEKFFLSKSFGAVRWKSVETGVFVKTLRVSGVRLDSAWNSVDIAKQTVSRAFVFACFQLPQGIQLRIATKTSVTYFQQSTHLHFWQCYVLAKFLLRFFRLGSSVCILCYFTRLRFLWLVFPL